MVTIVPIRLLRPVCFVALSLLAVAGVRGQSGPIVIDESFDDWQEVEALYRLEPGQAGYFRGLWAASDRDYVYLYLELSEELILQESPLVLWIDTDADAETGVRVGDIGAELRWHFGRREGTVYRDGAALPIRHPDIGVVNAPTVSSTRFEIALRRDAMPDGETRLLDGEEIRLLIHHNDGGGSLPPNETGLTFRLTDTPRERETVSLKRPPRTHLRVMAYNVERDAIFDAAKRAAYGRILRALEPDVIGFTEIYNGTAEQVRAILEDIYPIDGPWHVEKPVISGGTAPGNDIVLASRYPITHAEPVVWHAFRAPRTGAFVLDLRPAFDTDLLVYVSHPNCCQSTDLRQQQLDAQMDHLRNWKTSSSHGTPFMHIGDFNLVTDRVQQRTVLEGLIVNDDWQPSFAPDWDDTALADLKPRVTGLPMTFTWHDEASSFSPGRLDYVVYSDYSLEALGGVALFTPAMEDEELQAHELEAEDVTTASDHLPLVADFRFVHAVSVHAPLPRQEDDWMLQIYPNPARDELRIALGTPLTGRVTIELVDVTGRRVGRWVESGSEPVILDVSGFPAGMYFVRVARGDAWTTTPVMIAR